MNYKGRERKWPWNMLQNLFGIEQVGLNGRAADLNSGVSRFESRPGHRLSWLMFFVVPITPLRQMPRYITVRPDHFLLHSFQFIIRNYYYYYYYYYYYSMALQPISGLGLLFMRFRNLTLIDNWYDSLDEWSELFLTVRNSNTASVEHVFKNIKLFLSKHLKVYVIIRHRSLWHHYEVTGSYFQRTIWTKITKPEISLSTQNFSSVKLELRFLRRWLWGVRSSGS
jgi:hypothetical protein